MDGYSDNRPDNGSGAALVLGILSIVFLFICQVAGLILGIIGLRRSGRGRGTSRDADAAWVLSVIGIVLNAVIIAATVIGIIILLILFNGIMDSFYYW